MASTKRNPHRDNGNPGTPTSRRWTGRNKKYHLGEEMRRLSDVIFEDHAAAIKVGNFDAALSLISAADHLVGQAIKAGSLATRSKAPADDIGTGLRSLAERVKRAQIEDARERAIPTPFTDVAEHEGANGRGA